MNELDCKSVMAAIQGEYGALWHCLKRGNTLEIVTPYLYPDKGFVSVFITTRRGNIVVSDGGGVAEFVRNATDDEAFESGVLGRFIGIHGVQRVEQGERVLYFKECNSVKLVPSVVFDLCNFVVAVSSASVMAVTDEDGVEKESFRVKADHFIKLRVSNERTVAFNRCLSEVPEARFSAIITGTSRLWLVIYLTGCDLNHFTRSVSNAIINVEFARSSSLGSQIAATVPLVNDQAVGYQPMKLQQRLERLREVSKGDAISWTNKEAIDERLAVA